MASHEAHEEEEGHEEDKNRGCGGRVYSADG
jgi:hypothetical protein